MATTIGRLTLGIVLAMSASFSAIGCSGPAEGGEGTTASAEAALRALEPNEIVGSISYGQTLGPIAYTEMPLYRALSFSGKAGDTIDIAVRCPNGIAAAWLLRADFSTISSTRATSSTHDANITATLAATATYYIAFREANQEDLDFSVSLSSSVAPPPPPPPPPPPDNPWACSDTKLGLSDLLRRFVPGASAVNVLSSVGAVRIEQRIRTCNEQTGCTGWGALSPVAGNDGALATLSLAVTSGGAVTLHIASASDSDATYDVSNGSIQGASHHTPNHTNVPVEGSVTATCLGYRLQTKQSATTLGTWTETEFGVRTGFPGAVPQPPSVTTNVWTCAGSALTAGEITRRIPVGGDTLDVLSGRTLGYEERHRSCNVATGCTSWTNAAPVAGNDGRVAAVTIQTIGSSGLQLRILSASDSDTTFSLSSGSFTTASFHTPNHTNVPTTGIITPGCMAWSMDTRQATDSSGTWSETSFGLRSDFPAAVR